MSMTKCSICGKTLVEADHPYDWTKKYINKETTHLTDSKGGRHFCSDHDEDEIRDHLNTFAVAKEL